ncbi:MAG: DUF1761 domain-containing protein [Bacteroidota bacterium]
MYIYYLVPLSSIICFVLGILWYSPFLLGNLWQKEVTLRESTKVLRGRAFVGSFLMMNVMAWGMSWLLEKLYINTYFEGALFGWQIGALFVGTSMATNYLYQNKIILWVIDGTYQILCMGVMGAIIAGLKD